MVSPSGPHLSGLLYLPALLPVPCNPGPQACWCLFISPHLQPPSPSRPPPRRPAFPLWRGHSLLQTAYFALGSPPDICFHFSSVGTRTGSQGAVESGRTPTSSPLQFLGGSLSLLGGCLLSPLLPPSIQGPEPTAASANLPPCVPVRECAHIHTHTVTRRLTLLGTHLACSHVHTHMYPHTHGHARTCTHVHAAPQPLQGQSRLYT